MYSIRQTILIIEENPDITAALCKILSAGKYDVRVAASGRGGLASISGERPDLILVAALLPDMSGNEFCRRLRLEQSERPVPVILIGGPAGSAERTALFSMTAVDYIALPVEAGEVHRRIRGMLALSRAGFEEAISHSAPGQESLGPDGSPPGTIESLKRELELLKSSEAAAREGEARYRLLVEHANDAVYIAQDRVIKFPNPRAVKMTGYSAAELAETPFEKLIHEEDREMVTARHEKRLAATDVLPAYEFRIVTRRGEVKRVELNAVTIIWEGKPAALCVLRDVTGQHAERGRAFRAGKMAALAALGRGIAHDFNNVLSIVFGYNNLAMLHLDKPERLKNDIQEIQKGALRAKSLLDQILTFSRNSKQEKQSLDVARAVEEAVENLPQPVPDGVLVRRNLTAGGTIATDPALFKEVVAHLCTNAYHAMGDSGGTLDIALNMREIGKEETDFGFEIVSGKYLELTFSDTGSGMDEETLDRIFDPYFTTKKKGDGKGLGLSIVHGIVRNGGGHIGVHSEKGVGTSFRVYLPAAEEKRRASSQKPSGERTGGGNERIMFVDDEEQIVKVARLALTRYGYRVTAFDDSGQAFRAFEKEPDQYDLVISDMTMPGMDGVELLKGVLKKRPGMPVILCSGYSDPAKSEEIKGMNIRFYQKPIVISEFVSAVREVLDTA